MKRRNYFELVVVFLLNITIIILFNNKNRKADIVIDTKLLYNILSIILFAMSSFLLVWGFVQLYTRFIRPLITDRSAASLYPYTVAIVTSPLVNGEYHDRHDMLEITMKFKNLTDFVVPFSTIAKGYVEMGIEGHVWVEWTIDKCGEYVDHDEGEIFVHHNGFEPVIDSGH